MYIFQASSDSLYKLCKTFSFLFSVHTYIHTYLIGSSPRGFSESILHYKIINQVHDNKNITDYFNAYPSLMYSLLLATELTWSPLLTIIIISSIIQNHRVIFVPITSRKYLKPKSLSNTKLLTTVLLLKIY